MDSMNENVIEWLRGQKTATVTLANNTKLNSKVKKLSKEKPEDCQIVVENKDGSIVAHVPLKWIKINPPRQMSEEQRQAIAERARRFGFKKKAEALDDDDTDDYEIDDDEEE